MTHAKDQAVYFAPEESIPMEVPTHIAFYVRQFISTNRITGGFVGIYLHPDGTTFDLSFIGCTCEGIL